MDIFLYEFATGGGLLDSALPDSAPPDSHPLFDEGRAMVDALAADFRAIDGAHVHTLRDIRLRHHPARSDAHVVDVATRHEEAAAFGRLAAMADWTVIIAPESDGELLRRWDWAMAAGGQILGPPRPIVALAADKDQTARHLRAAALPVADGWIVEADQPVARAEAHAAYPLVVKPNDGAGADEVYLLRGADDEPPASSKRRRVEVWQEGIAASVALLCGPNGHLALPACRQHILEAHELHYDGGSLPLPPPLARRARQLAMRVAASLDRPSGYLGVDLVLGTAADGSGDCVLEINPRLTTSYVGLRASTAQNLAAAMIDVASGESPSLFFRTDPLTFTTRGAIQTRTLCR